MAWGELILIRHGETDSPGTLNGRTDVGLASVPDPVSFRPDALWSSPARRARETAEGLFPGTALNEDARLWEQDFGEWDGLDLSELPDVGSKPLEELMTMKAGNGESFEEMSLRVRPALEEAAALALAEDLSIAVVAHAGTVRAAIALAIGNQAPALAFQIGHLKATRIRCISGGFAITAVNESLL